MSFYGNVFYELADSLARILVKNSGQNNNAFITPGQDIEVPVIGLNGKMILDSGNKWIQLQGTPGEHLCTVYHAQRDELNTDNELTTFAKVDEQSNSIELSPGDYLQGLKFYYDDAGHIAGHETIYYKLPVSETELELQDIQARLGAVEDSDRDQQELIEGHTEAIDTVTLQANTTDETLTELKNFVGNKVFMTTGNTTITQAIGNLKDISDSTDGASVSAGIVNLSGKINSQGSQIQDLSYIQRAVINDLCDQLEELNIGITIDRNRLWEGTNATS